jgi:uncharacterized protein YbcC (UPF0753/DUF2309 family)
MKVVIDEEKLIKGFQKLTDKFLVDLKEYAEKWYEDEEIPDWMSTGIIEWVDAVDKIKITHLQVRKDDIGSTYYISVDAILDSVQRFDIDEILQHISYLIIKRMFGFRSGNTVIMISNNVELKNTDPQW